MDRWAFAQLQPWVEVRASLPVGPLLCILHGRSAGRAWEASAARRQLHATARLAGVRRRFAPHQLRHAHAVELAHEDVPIVVIQRLLGHAHLGITSVYLQGIDTAEIIDTVHGRRAPVISATPAFASAGSGAGDKRDGFSCGRLLLLRVAARHIVGPERRQGEARLLVLRESGTVRLSARLGLPSPVTSPPGRRKGWALTAGLVAARSQARDYWRGEPHGGWPPAGPLIGVIR